MAVLRVDVDYYLYALGSLKDFYDKDKPRDMDNIVSLFVNTVLGAQYDTYVYFDESEPVEIKLYLSGEDNFRNDIATIKPYKGNRDRSTRPDNYYILKEKVSQIEDIEVSESINKEADDDIAYDHYKSYGEGIKSVVCSVDKDFKQVPGVFYDAYHKHFIEISELDACRSFYHQLLTGDVVDNIPGLFGVGDKSAHVLRLYTTDNEDVMFSDVYDQYKKRFGSYAEQFLTENAKLLFLMREGEQWEWNTRIMNSKR